MFGNYIKTELKRMFKRIAHWKKFTIMSWHVGDEHIHLYVSISPKYSVAYIVAILKSKKPRHGLKRKLKKYSEEVFGLEDTLCQRLDLMKWQSDHILPIRNLGRLTYRSYHL